MLIGNLQRLELNPNASFFCFCLFFLEKLFCFLMVQKWHPDRCSATGNLELVEEAKKKFQEIREAYSGKCPLNASTIEH